MAYEGKFVDRSPKIIPAGLVAYKKDESLKGLLVDINKDYSDYEYKKPTPRNYDARPRPRVADPRVGYFTNARLAVNPEVKSVFQSLLQDFGETRYRSYWFKRVGRRRDPLPGLPDNMDPESVRFGWKYPRDYKAGDVLNPRKTDAEIIAESKIGHKNYVKTHKSYDPGEQVERNYSEPPLNKNLVFGITRPQRKEGGCMKSMLEWDTDTRDIGDRQREFEDTWVIRKLGKVHTPNNNIENVPRGHTFGIVTKEEKPLKAEDSFNFGPIVKDKKDRIEIFELVNYLRNLIHKRIPVFPTADLISTFQYLDKGHTQCISFEKAYEVISQFQIKVSKDTFYEICRVLGIMCDNGKLIKYYLLIDIFCPNRDFPEQRKIKDLPDELVLFKTIYQSSYETEIHKRKGEPAKIAIETEMSGRTDAYMSLWPSIYTQLRLSRVDFFRAFDKEQMARILKKVELEIPDDKFEIVWEKAASKDKDGDVCLDSFTKQLKEEMPELKIFF